LNVDILGEQKKVTFKFSARDLLEKNCGRGSWKRRTPNPHDLVFAGWQNSTRIISIPARRLLYQLNLRKWHFYSPSSRWLSVVCCLDWETTHTQASIVPASCHFTAWALSAVYFGNQWDWERLNVKVESLAAFYATQRHTRTHSHTCFTLSLSLRDFFYKAPQLTLLDMCCIF